MIPVLCTDEGDGVFDVTISESASVIETPAQLTAYGDKHIYIDIFSVTNDLVLAVIDSVGAIEGFTGTGPPPVSYNEGVDLPDEAVDTYTANVEGDFSYEETATHRDRFVGFLN